MPYNVTVDDISPIIVYAGNWTDFCDRDPNRDPTSSLYYGKTFHSSRIPGSKATIRFNGTAIYIYGSKRPNYGYYTVAVDNGTPRNFDAYGEPQAGVMAQQLLFGQTGLEDTLHEVVFTNVEGNNGRMAIDIDYVTWTVGGNSPLLTTTLDDTHQNWTYTSPWDLRSGNDVYNGSTHLVRTLGARASLTFEGVGIYLYGHLWKDHGRFNVTIDDRPPVTLSSYASAWFAQVPLYYADDLGPGTHTITAINAEESKVLSLDSVRILTPESPVIVPPPTTTNNAPSIRNTGMIGGIIGGAAALVILAAFLGWYWIRRRGRYKSIDAWDARNGGFPAPPVGYAPKTAGPGWVDGVTRPYSYAGFPSIYGSAQPSPNSQLGAGVTMYTSQATTRAKGDGSHSR
ncbi:hypothetical protein FRC11_010639 [Ceratobasidium sp. 423]|nr:hypothetical protein FRC11_010639 [Ceratobasidium sp. 423]